MLSYPKVVLFVCLSSFDQLNIHIKQRQLRAPGRHLQKGNLVTVSRRLAQIHKASGFGGRGDILTIKRLDNKQSTNS